MKLNKTIAIFAIVSFFIGFTPAKAITTDTVTQKDFENIKEVVEKQQEIIRDLERNVDNLEVKVKILREKEPESNNNDLYQSHIIPLENEVSRLSVGQTYHKDRLDDLDSKYTKLKGIVLSVRNLIISLIEVIKDFNNSLSR